MLIGIIGGRLQGLEAAYLAREAQYEVMLIDKDALAPARGLVDKFYHLDLLQASAQARTLLNTCDLILPATENHQTLSWLNEAARRWQIPLALDLPAYSVTSSKVLSNQFLKRIEIPMPSPWPVCGFPVIVKPSGLSGSEGVMRVNNNTHLRKLMSQLREEPIIQAFLEGASYSLEILGHRGDSVCFQVTELGFDSGYDCKRVLAGPNTGNAVEESLCELAERIGRALSLSGIMDVEVIDTAEGLKVLEIDARLPSQTPSAVYHSTGLNLLELLAEYWTCGTLPDYEPARDKRRAVIYEHFRLKNGVLETAGEHILREAQGLELYRERFSAKLMISNFEASPRNWVATCVFEGQTESQVWRRHARAVQKIQKQFKCRSFLDPGPSY